ELDRAEVGALPIRDLVADAAGVEEPDEVEDLPVGPLLGRRSLDGHPLLRQVRLPCRDLVRGSGLPAEPAEAVLVALADVEAVDAFVHPQQQPAVLARGG